jgi:hypothetical protein
MTHLAVLRMASRSAMGYHGYHGSHGSHGCHGWNANLLLLLATGCHGLRRATNHPAIPLGGVIGTSVADMGEGLNR